MFSDKILLGLALFLMVGVSMLVGAMLEEWQRERRKSKNVR